MGVFLSLSRNQELLESTVKKHACLTSDDSNAKAMPRCLDNITHRKSMTLISPQGTEQAVVL